MSPKFEVEIPDKDLEAFRNFVAGIPDAGIISDEAARKERLEKERELRLNLIEKLNEPCPSEREEKILQSFQALFQSICSEETLGNVFPERLLTLTELDLTRQRLHDEFIIEHEAGGLTVREVFVLIKRFGLTDGISRTPTEVNREWGWSHGRSVALENRAVHKLRWINRKRPIFPASCDEKPRHNSEKKFG